MRRGLIFAVIGAGLVAACAISEPPPGGPEDKKPPKVASSIPAPDSGGVSRDASVSLTFDENMTRERLERSVAFWPPVVIRHAKWHGSTLVLEPDGPLHADTTYVVELKPGFSDAHGVASPDGYRFAFATSVAVDSGVVEGHVYFRRKPSDRGVVRLFVLPKDSTFSAEAFRPDREIAVRGDGFYRISYLPTRPSRFILWAFQDVNADGAFDREKEVGELRADTVTLTVAQPRAVEHDFYIVDPREPAEIGGRVVRGPGLDTLIALITFSELTDTMPPTYVAHSDRGGNYSLANVLQGRYIVRAFIDFRADSLCGSYPCPGDSDATCLEPCVEYPDTLAVTPGAKIKMEDMVLETARPQDGRSE